ncbi:MAG: DUF2125 domain-containing protein [Alphaproteobacteria bacterium]|nr:DUF2125 domain-containing protein [Alphaproteobacteria bacterium]
MDRDNVAAPRLRPLGILLLAVFVPLGLYSASWLYMATTVRAEIGRWADTQRARGYQVTYEAINLSGFPLRFEVNITKPILQAPEAAGSWRWSTAILSGQMNPFVRNKFILTTPGPQEIRLPSFPKSGESTNAPIATITAVTATATIKRRSNGTQGQASLILDAADISGLVSGSAVHVERLDAAAQWFPAPHPSDHTTRTLTLSASSHGIDLPPALGLPFGPRIETIALDADVNGTLADGELLPSLENWRENGGTVELHTLTLQWPPLQLSANGTLALDDQLQPMGAFSTNLQGFSDALDALSRDGIVRPRDSSMAKAMLGTLAKAPAGGGVRVPLTLQNRALFAGPVKLLQLPDVRWSNTHQPRMENQPEDKDVRGLGPSHSPLIR